MVYIAKDASRIVLEGGIFGGTRNNPYLNSTTVMFGNFNKKKLNSELSDLKCRSDGFAVAALLKKSSNSQYN